MTFPAGIAAVVGIDQTGAVAASGEPKPLYAACLELGAPATLATNGRLASLREGELRRFLPSATQAGRVLVVVDSVLGLPEELGVPLARLLEDAKDFTFRSRPHGAETAYQFFRRYLPPPAFRREGASYPQRTAEKLAGANSVFRKHPFQKNVGCGSYRVLKDLGVGPRWFRVWPQEEAGDAQFIVVEGYPSLFWRDVLGSRVRMPEVLRHFLAESFPQAHLPKTADDADAAVLAIGGARCLEAGYFELFPRAPTARAEGWILGLAPEEAS